MNAYSGAGAANQAAQDSYGGDQSSLNSGGDMPGGGNQSGGNVSGGGYVVCAPCILSMNRMRVAQRICVQ